MAQTIDKKLEFIKVPKIDKPGEYRFATNGNWDGNGSWDGIASNAIIDDCPEMKHYEIVRYLHKKFSTIFLQHFIPASLTSGEYEPASFRFEQPWKGELFGFGENNYLGFDGEMYCLSESGSNSGGSGSWNFAIKDIGNLSIAKNRLIIAKPQRRNGEIDLRISGYSPHHSNTRKWWRGWLDYKGNSQGKLVQAIIDHLNSETERKNVPLWVKDK